MTPKLIEFGSWGHEGGGGVSPSDKAKLCQSPKCQTANSASSVSPYQYLISPYRYHTTMSDIECAIYNNLTAPTAVWYWYHFCFCCHPFRDANIGCKRFLSSVKMRLSIFSVWSWWWSTPQTSKVNNHHQLENLTLFLSVNFGLPIGYSVSEKRRFGGYLRY